MNICVWYNQRHTSTRKKNDIYYNKGKKRQDEKVTRETYYILCTSKGKEKRADRKYDHYWDSSSAASSCPEVDRAGGAGPD